MGVRRFASVIRSGMARADFSRHAAEYRATKSKNPSAAFVGQATAAEYSVVLRCYHNGRVWFLARGNLLAVLGKKLHTTIPPAVVAPL
jgi:hypothetical protein